MTGRLSLASLLGGEGCNLCLRAARQFILRVLFTHPNDTSGWANGRPPLSQGRGLKADSLGPERLTALVDGRAGDGSGRDRIVGSVQYQNLTLVGPERHRRRQYVAT
jgi:hypothetical protein